MPVSNLTEESELQRGGGAFVNANDRYRRNYKQLDSQYDVWKAAYKEVSDYIALGRGRYVDYGEQSNQKSKAASKVINNTATDALHMIPGVDAGNGRSPAIMGDAAHAVLTRNAAECNGQFLIDDDVLRATGITDLSHYAVDPSKPLLPDLYLDA